MTMERGPVGVRAGHGEGVEVIVHLCSVWEGMADNQAR